MSEQQQLGDCYGERGTLADDGEKAQCHECGKWYAGLGYHVRITHGMSASEYKREFGLNEGTGLISSALAEKRRASVWHLEAYHEEATARFINQTLEERSARSRAREIREQHLRDPKTEENRRRMIEAARLANSERGRRNRVAKTCPACEREFTVARKDRDKITTCSGECRREHRREIVAPQSIEALRRSAMARKDLTDAIERGEHRG